jgi:hypothetical protein
MVFNSPPHFLGVVLKVQSCDCCRTIDDEEVQIADLQQQLAALQSSSLEVEAELADKVSEVNNLQTEKEIQAGGEVKELQQEVDELAMR